MECKICEEAELDADDCPCPNEEDHHCEVCAHIVGFDGYCNHCDAFPPDPLIQNGEGRHGMEAKP